MMVVGEGTLRPSQAAGSEAGKARRGGAWYSCAVVAEEAPVVVLVYGISDQ